MTALTTLLAADPAGEAAAAPVPTEVPYSPVYRSLMVVGLLGAVYSTHDDADIVNTAIEPTLPNPMNYRINRALALGMGGRSKAAADMLKADIDANPQDDAAKVVLAVSMMISGDPQWKGLLESVLASSPDANAREAATRIIASQSKR